MLRGFLCLALLAAVARMCPGENMCRQCTYEDPETEKTCLICDRSFLNPKTKKCDEKVTSKIKNCLSYDFVAGRAQMSCTLCKEGSGLHEASNSCVECKTEGCALCDPEGQRCYGCFDNRQIELDGQGFKCSGNKCPIDNCNVCKYDKDSKTHSCHRCNGGFTFDTEAKKCVQAPTQNCLKMKFGKCFLCDVGFAITEGDTCVPSSFGVNGQLLAIVVMGVLLALIIGFISYRKNQTGVRRPVDGYVLTN